VKARQRKTYCGVASQKGGAWATAGRTVSREEFQRDYGADLDDLLDGPDPGTKSEPEAVTRRAQNFRPGVPSIC
jgi:hypothetical protein